MGNKFVAYLARVKQNQVQKIYMSVWFFIQKSDTNYFTYGYSFVSKKGLFPKAAGIL